MGHGDHIWQLGKLYGDSDCHVLTLSLSLSLNRYLLVTAVLAIFIVQMVRLGE